MIQTNWSILTGTYCAGKSACAAHLSSVGQLVPFSEVALTHLDSLRSQYGVQELEGLIDPEQTLNDIFDKMHQLEIGLLDSAEIVLYLDRAMPDQIAFARLKGFDDTRMLRIVEESGIRYKTIFNFDALPIEDSAIPRTPGEERRMDLAVLVREVYQDLGYEQITVPKMSVAERAQYLIDSSNNVELDYNQVVTNERDLNSSGILID